MFLYFILKFYIYLFLGNFCLVNEIMNGNVLVMWIDVFSLIIEMEFYYIVYFGFDVGFLDFF